MNYVIYFLIFSCNNLLIIYLTYSPSNPTQGTSVYTIPRITKQDEGSYICKGQSLAGDMEEILQILVLQENDEIRPDYEDYNPEGYRPEYEEPIPNTPVSVEETSLAPLGTIHKIRRPK